MTDLDPRFLATEYVVKANGNEAFFLWKLHSDEVSWEQGGSGVILELGKLGGHMQEKRPVMISCFWNRINGMNVLFWYACSQVVDYRMIDEWFKANCYPITSEGKHAECDSMNFDHCIRESKNGRPKKKTGLITPPEFYYRKPSSPSTPLF